MVSSRSIAGRSAANTEMQKAITHVLVTLHISAILSYYRADLPHFGPAACSKFHLVFKLQGKLNDTRIRKRAGNRAKGCGGEVGRRVGKRRVVPDVEELDQEAQFQRLTQPCDLGNPGVPQVRPGTAHGVAAQSAVSGPWCSREGSRVEIVGEFRRVRAGIDGLNAVDRISAPSGARRSSIPVMIEVALRIAHRERRAGFDRGHTRNLPEPWGLARKRTAA